MPELGISWTVPFKLNWTQNEGASFEIVLECQEMNVLVLLLLGQSFCVSEGSFEWESASYVDTRFSVSQGLAFFK